MLGLGFYAFLLLSDNEAEVRRLETGTLRQTMALSELETGIWTSTAKLNRLTSVAANETDAKKIERQAKALLAETNAFAENFAKTRKAVSVAGVPFAEKTDRLSWEIKLGLLAVIFVYAFFKFTWSMRQFNYTALLICATPPPEDPDCAAAARRAARMGDLAVKHFNDGIRAYYFGLAALTWFVHPWAFVVASSWVVLVLWRREFRSNTLSALRD